MSFQWIIDNAETISINTRKVVANTQARDGTVRAVSRGNQIWTFDVKLPDGMAWTNMRKNIALAEQMDRTTSTTIQLTNPGQNWLVKYQGDGNNLTAFGGGIAVANITKGSSTITLTSAPTGVGSGQYRFRAGDYIQLGSSGKVYKVAADVIAPSTTVTLHRPILDNSANNVIIFVAQYVTWTVMCTNFPNWTLFSRDQISWDGSFKFVEVLY